MLWCCATEQYVKHFSLQLHVWHVFVFKLGRLNEPLHPVLP